MSPVMEPEVEVEVPAVINPIADLDLADHYDLAASLLEEHGWIQGSLGIKPLGFCMIGAINQTFGDSYRLPPSASLESQLPSGLTVYSIHVPIIKATGEASLWNGGGAIWNDQQGRTKEEVITKLREVAKELRDGNASTASF